MKTITKGYVGALHIALAYLVLNTSAGAGILTKLGIEHPSAARAIEARQAELSKTDGLIDRNHTVVFGDSNMAAFAPGLVWPGVINYSVPGARSDQLLAWLGRLTAHKSAGHVVIMVGTNDVLQGAIANLRANYPAILSQVPEATPITVIGPPQITRSGYENDAVDASRVARDACLQRTGCRFVDLQAAIVQGGGVESHFSDGVHLSAKGYSALVSVVQE